MMTSNRILPPALVATLLQFAGPPAVLAAGPAPLTVTLPDLESQGTLPDGSALCPPTATSSITRGRDQSPTVAWSNAPAETQSFALIMTDPDVPLDSTVLHGQRPIPVDAPRVTRYHWVLYNIPATLTSLPAGADGDGFVPHGKPAIRTEWGQRGVNANTWMFAGNPGLRGTYAGYDGPCPPVNDLKPHSYIVTVYALDVGHLDAGPLMAGPQLLQAMEGHVLARGQAVGLYSRNPALRKTDSQ